VESAALLVAPGEQAAGIDRSALGRTWAFAGSVRHARPSGPRAPRPSPVPLSSRAVCSSRATLARRLLAGEGAVV